MSRAAAARGARPAGRVRIEARAKLNLGLAVGPRRADGFHDLATVFQSISLADTLLVAPRRRGFRLAVRHEPAWTRPGAHGAGAAAAAVPRGPANLVLRAARCFASRYGIGGAKLTLIRRIPAGAGLGGGSADAAAALVGLARLHGFKPRAGELRALGATLGSDVPFALFGGTALGLGRGERLRRLRLARPFRAILAVPAWRVPTADAFRRMDRNQYKYGLTRPTAILRFSQSLGREAITVESTARLGNTFEEVLGKRRSEFLSLCARLRRAGAEGPHLTGSGSAVFAIVPAGLSARRIVERFIGQEAVYLIRSRRIGLSCTRLP